jgi:predicted double-glycine peptidase
MPKRIMRRAFYRLSIVGLILPLALVSVRQSVASEPPRGTKSVQNLLDIRDAQVVRQHWDLSCGAAAIATLLTYQLNYPVTERQVALALLHHTNPLLVRLRLGFSLLDLKRYATGLGFEAAGYANLSVADLAALVPVVVPLRSNGFNHFIVVRSLSGGRVFIADPAFGNRTMTVEAFRKEWANGIAFVVRSPREPQAPNRMTAPDKLMPVPSIAALREAEKNAHHIAGGL